MAKPRLNNPCFVNILTLTPFLFSLVPPLEIAQLTCNWMSFIFLLSILYSNNVRKTFTSNYVTKNPSLDCDNRELKQRRRRRQRERQKSNRIRLTKQQLCKCISLFWTLRCRHCTIKTWNFLISRLIADVSTRQRFSFSFCELLRSFRSHLQVKSPKFDKVKELD